MSFINDLKLWRDFVKSVKKSDRLNVAVRNEVRHPKHISVKSRNNRIQEFIDNRGSFSHTNVSPLTKREKKNFESKASIDLHGHTREIDGTLNRFCTKCILSDLREVTIITGKGEGIVKSATRQWLENNPQFVIGFFEIKDSRGESGSYGVRLRK